MLLDRSFVLNVAVCLLLVQDASYCGHDWLYICFSYVLETRIWPLFCLIFCLLFVCTHCTCYAFPGKGIMMESIGFYKVSPMLYSPTNPTYDANQQPTMGHAGYRDQSSGRLCFRKLDLIFYKELVLNNFQGICWKPILTWGSRHFLYALTLPGDVQALIRTKSE